MRYTKSNILLPLAMVIGIVTGSVDKITAREAIIFSLALELNKDSTTNPVVKETTSPTTSATSSDGPIRDWSNPPGFKGYSNDTKFKMKKHKGLSHKKKKGKYHPKKKDRCYSF